ncbi:MAG: 3-hydroxyacyl-CoA dehydrogenase NAD-binding domain-containing protein [Candidatus Odinarchaeota archaeon]
MKLGDVKHVAVLGAGAMGHSIAELALLTGYTVSLYDIKDEIAEKGKSMIEWSLQKLLAKGKFTDDDYKRFMVNLSLTADFEEAVKNADLCIEAAPEIFDLKKKIFSELDDYAPRQAILTSNTSNMSITEIAAETRRPEKVAGTHFFNPPVIMPMVEIVTGEKTSRETIDILVHFMKTAGKKTILSRDSPGFICNRIMAPHLLYLQLLLDRKEYLPAKIDAAVLNTGMAIGPYELVDYLGLDVVYNSLKYLEKRLSKDYAPTPTLEKLVKEKKLGKKTGEGIYKWPEGARPEIDRSDPVDFNLMELVWIQINEAAKVLEEGVGNANDIDTGIKLGFDYPQGPFEVAEVTDLAELTAFLDGIADKYGKEVFRAHQWLRDGTLMDQVRGEYYEGD